MSLTTDDTVTATTSTTTASTQLTERHALINQTKTLTLIPLHFSNCSVNMRLHLICTVDILCGKLKNKYDCLKKIKYSGTKTDVNTNHLG
jgi:hypothetical protein